MLFEKHASILKCKRLELLNVSIKCWQNKIGNTKLILPNVKKLSSMPIFPAIQYAHTYMLVQLTIYTV